MFVRDIRRHDQEQKRICRKVIYLDPSVNKDSTFALGSFDGLNRDLHAMSKLGIVAEDMDVVEEFLVNTFFAVSSSSTDEAHTRRIAAAISGLENDDPDDWYETCVPLIIPNVPTISSPLSFSLQNPFTATKKYILSSLE